MNYATYCPEDNKLRLYVGRVPRDEYETLRAEGWKSTPKQDCDFVATWTPQREDTALEYSGGTLEDEDQSPTDRAADRAERFAGYREKREEEAHGHADTYDNGPSAHGYQSQALAERRAAKHDLQATRAVTQWSKAEYWQQRTAGVIANALYKSAPGVRMGRIKVLEVELRRFEGSGTRTENHLRLRLAYENQMLAAQGGRLASVDIEVGGWIGKQRVESVNKSPATGRVTSVKVRVPRVKGWHYQVANVQGADYALLTIETERLAPDAYRAPTEQEREDFLAMRKAEKKERSKTLPKKPPLVNPTEEDAKKLQELLNQHDNRRIYREDKDICLMTQAEYSAISRGTYSAAETKGFEPGGRIVSGSYNRASLPACCKARIVRGRVVVLSDKPKKSFPVELWHDKRGELRDEIIRDSMGELSALSCRSWCNDEWTEEDNTLFHNARLAGLAYKDSMTQFGLTELGIEAAKTINAQVA